MNWINIDGKLLNLDTVVAVSLDDAANTFIVETAHRTIDLPLDDAGRAAYAWLVGQCVGTFQATTSSEARPAQLSQPAWHMLLRIERHEDRTGLPGLPIDDDDMETTIELERQMYIKTSVHEAWLTDNGREMLAEHRAANSADNTTDETQEAT